MPPRRRLRLLRCAGRRAELLHDIVDEIFVGDASSSRFAKGVEVMTTWHDSEPPDEVAFFLLRNAGPSLGTSTIIAILEPPDDALRRAIEIVATSAEV